MEPSHLSKILSGKRSVTEASIRRVARSLRLSSSETEVFAQTYISMETSRKRSMENYRQLTLDQFEVISDWYHYAILELVLIAGFRPSPKWIAKSLGITLIEARDAVERLFRLGYLEATPEGGWVNRSGNHTTLSGEYTAVALRKLQSQILSGAICSLESIPLQERDQTAVTLAVRSELLPLAKKKIQKFRREMAKLLHRPPGLDRVYQLSVSLYPVSPAPVSLAMKRGKK